MKFLMICTKYPTGVNDSYMTTELADALVTQGHEVSVAVIDWDAPLGAASGRVTTATGVDVLIMAPRGTKRLGRLIERITKWGLSSLLARREMSRVFGKASFDAVLAFTPCVTVASQLNWAKRTFGARSMLFVYDFFPYHQKSIGLIPAPLYPLALFVEQRLVAGFDVIGCHLPVNIEYLRRHYPIRPDQRVVWTPLWTDISRPIYIDSATLRAAYGLPVHKKIVVFGGQLTQGRGIEEMLQVADRAATDQPDLAFLFVGDGRLSALVEEWTQRSNGNVHLIKRVPREHYLQLISACDLGLVATVPGVDSASSPTKILDYLRANLPIVAALEEQNDLKLLLVEWGVGCAVTVGDVDGMYAAIVELLAEGLSAEERQARTTFCLEKVFDVQLAAKNVIRCMSATGS